MSSYERLVTSGILVGILCLAIGWYVRWTIRADKAWREWAREKMEEESRYREEAMRFRIRSSEFIQEREQWNKRSASMQREIAELRERLRSQMERN